jgi:hypothetical protein
MACNADDYRYAWECVARVFSSGVNSLASHLEFLAPYFRKVFLPFEKTQVAAIILTVTLMPALALGFVYIGTRVLPKLIKWYYEKTIAERAEEYFQRRCVATGMTKFGAKVSIGLGVVFYFLMRIAAAFPEHVYLGLGGLILALIFIDFIGQIYAGNVPDSLNARIKYIKRFYAPTVTGLGLAVGTVTLDFIVQGLIVGISYLKVIVVGAHVAT